MADPFYARPIFCVADVSASVAYYRDRLGFEPGWAHPETAPIIAQVGRDGLDLILDSGSVIPRAAIPSVVSVSVGNVSALYGELEAAGARITERPAPVHWQPGLLQLVIEDPDGNQLVFWGDAPK